jgi:hypothetical protein
MYFGSETASLSVMPLGFLGGDERASLHTGLLLSFLERLLRDVRDKERRQRKGGFIPTPHPKYRTACDNSASCSRDENADADEKREGKASMWRSGVSNFIPPWEEDTIEEEEKKAYLHPTPLHPLS